MKYIGVYGKVSPSSSPFTLIPLSPSLPSLSPFPLLPSSQLGKLQVLAAGPFALWRLESYKSARL